MRGTFCYHDLETTTLFNQYTQTLARTYIHRHDCFINQFALIQAANVILINSSYLTPSGKRISGASIFFESFPYKVNPQTGYIDYDKLEEKVLDYRPKILICGGSSYPREWDYARFRQLADKCGAVLMCDMAHISGIVAAKVVQH